MKNNNDVREDDVEKLAEEEYPDTKRGISVKWFEEKMEIRRKRTAFVKGYNKAKENTYTEEQVREAIRIIEPKELREYIIQSLKQPK